MSSSGKKSAVALFPPELVAGIIRLLRTYGHGDGRACSVLARRACSRRCHTRCSRRHVTVADTGCAPHPWETHRVRYRASVRTKVVSGYRAQHPCRQVGWHRRGHMNTACVAGTYQPPRKVTVPIPTPKQRRLFLFMSVHTQLSLIDIFCSMQQQTSVTLIANCHNKNKMYEERGYIL